MKIFEPLANYFYLLRIHHWVKNLFMLLPLFFSGQLFDPEKLGMILLGLLPFGFCASGIYILNDLRDYEYDKNHPVKSKRPIASGKVSKAAAISLLLILLAGGLAMAYIIKIKFGFILSLYVCLNIAYSFGLKHISILDIILVSIGFVLRIKAGGALASIGISEWLMLMVFLLALFMAVAKRRDDVQLMNDGAKKIRKASESYHPDFLNIMLAIIASIIMMAYLMYCLNPQTILRFHTYRLYYTSLFVLAGLFRYLQIAYVVKDAGSPTKVLYKDRFIQLTLFLWILSFYLIIYFPKIQLFG